MLTQKAFSTVFNWERKSTSTWSVLLLIFSGQFNLLIITLLKFSLWVWCAAQSYIFTIFFDEKNIAKVKKLAQICIISYLWKANSLTWKGFLFLMVKVLSSRPPRSHMVNSFGELFLFHEHGEESRFTNKCW